MSMPSFWFSRLFGGKQSSLFVLISFSHTCMACYFWTQDPLILYFQQMNDRRLVLYFLIASPPCLIPTVWQLLLLPNIPSSVEMFGYSDHRVITVDINVAVHGGHWDTSRIYPCEDTGINKHTIAHAAPVYQMPNFSAAHCIPTGLHNTVWNLWVIWNSSQMIPLTFALTLTRLLPVPWLAHFWWAFQHVYSLPAGTAQHSLGWPWCITHPSYKNLTFTKPLTMLEMSIKLKFWNIMIKFQFWNDF